MGLFDGKKVKALEQEVSRLQSMLSPEQREIENLNEEIEKLQSAKLELEAQLAKQSKDAEKELNKKSARLNELSRQLEQIKIDLVVTEEEVLLQSFGLYKPIYDFAKSEEYKARLEKVRAAQKDCIKSGQAATGATNWTVNNSASQGKKMVSDMQKLLLRAFNSECDELVGRVKYNNFEASLKRITSSCDAVSKLGKIMNIAITPRYRDLKIDELTLAFEYQQKKQQEKEEQKALREEMREQAKLQREIEEARRKTEKEQNHYQNALHKLESQIEAAKDEAHREELMKKKHDVEAELVRLDKAMTDIDYRQANQRAGYVYVISNVGAFGENVYKIGMTRRLDPTERVDELGDASVPFDFDIHAMIFSDDAPGLENALHKAFESKKLNWVNLRREFFNVTLEEIKAVVRQYHDSTAEFTDIAEAEQFRVSQKMKQAN